MLVYVLNKDGKPLMPCSPAKARHLLDAGQARVASRCPFTIRLLYGASGYVQEVVGALDTGTGTVGSAAVGNGRVLYQAETALRDDITGKLTQRRSYRRTRRGRKLRYRAARFDNRAASRRKGRLPPSLGSKVEGHLREMRQIAKILPVARWKLELAQFDIHRISDPSVSGKGYQDGPLKGFYNVKQYVLHRDGYRCRSGRAGPHSRKLHVHHRVYRSQGGTDAADNLLTLCESCHVDHHAGLLPLPVKLRKSRTQPATHMGVIKARLAVIAPPHGAVFGYETKHRREHCLGWPKTHANDAVAAALEDGETVLPLDTVLVKRHVAKGDYQRTWGAHSGKPIPTGKLFGFRKFDKVASPHGVGFVKGKRSSGYFAIADLDGNLLHASAKVSTLTRLAARSTTLAEQCKVAGLEARREEARATKTATQARKTGNAAGVPPLSLSAVNGGVSHGD